MSHIQQAIASLIAQANVAAPHQVRLTYEFEALPDVEFLDWLETQPLYPKFYWQSRDTHEEVVALGQVHSFNDPQPAYQILQGEQRIWGGRSFDGNTDKNPHCYEGFFFLPQVELLRQGDKLSLAVNLHQDRQITVAMLANLRHHITPLAPISSTIQTVQHTPCEVQWHNMVEQVLTGIKNEDFKKVVLARQTTATLDSPIAAAQLLALSRLANHNSFHFLLAIDDEHSFIGSTPERLYLRTDRELSTEALAGTIGRGHSSAQDEKLADWLSHDAKNLNENQYVVDDIVERLTPLSRDVSVESQVRLVQLRKVQHLKRGIVAKLNDDATGIHLLGALQPTAAVAGLPRKEAMNFIAEHEPFIRGWYAGSVGYISQHKAEFCVAIRSALVSDNQLQLFAGAGIVPGSVAEHEWQELNKKVSTLLSLISDSSAGE